MIMTALDETILLIIKYKLSGNLRFLSHAETMNVFKRACVRAQIPVVYSGGFNPRPKLSLPFPRSVAVETEDDLLVLKAKITHPADELQSKALLESLKTDICAELPVGIEILEVNISRKTKSPQPTKAAYVFTLSQDSMIQPIRARVDELQSRGQLVVERKTGENAKPRLIDVSDYIEDITIEDRSVLVNCKITASGSIRVDEIMTLLGIDFEMLSAPIKRNNVIWKF